MVPGDASRRLCERARAVAAEQGRELAETALGGADDGNVVSALGPPVLYGLGALGSGAHRPRPPRAQVLAMSTRCPPRAHGARHEHTVPAPVPARTAVTVGLPRSPAADAS
ncbi:hypothetical protein [Streptomyces hygroscopicus]|uniref:hypothetical protein n=1 Tax=Streptomyces hygroscopicus TaxID=1912 RepID=UPI00367999F2